MKTSKAFYGLNMAVVVLVAATGVSFGDTNIWTGAVNDWNWNNGGNFEDGLPSAGDVVKIPAGKTVRLLGDDSGSLGVVNSLARIWPMAADSRLVVSNDAAVSISCMIAHPEANEFYSDEGKCGEVVKKGGGELSLVNNNDLGAYNTSFTVEKGALRLPSAATKYKGHPHYYHRISVSNNATLFTVANTGYTRVKEVLGGGLVTNDSPNECYLQIWGGTYENPVPLEAKLAGKVRYYSMGAVDVLSTNNTLSAEFTVFNSTTNGVTLPCSTGISYFGPAGSPGSAGTANRLKYAEAGGRFRYIGKGETTSKGLLFATGSAYTGANELDGGPYGGLRFNFHSFISWYRVSNLRLLGTNANPCVIAAGIEPYTLNGSNNCITVTKRGSGAWQLSHSKSRSGVAGVSLEEGTLQVGSIFTKGEQCALGPGADNYPASYCAAADEAKKVPYSLSLGSREFDSVPLLELVGTNGAWCADREIVLRGDARIRNSATNSANVLTPMRLAGFSSITNGTSTLFLEGERNDTEDEIGCVSDGAAGGKVAVVKNGGGTWHLFGTNTFTGGLIVSNGTLAVISPSGKYTWFRWIIKQTNAGGSELQMQEFGLYDAGNRRVNGALAYCPDYAQIRAGQTALQKRIASHYGMHGKLNPPRDVDNLFDDANTWEGGLFHFLEYTSTGAARGNISPNDPGSWVYVLMRLDPDCAEVKTYDMAPLYANKAVKVWTLEGSVDGFTWDELDAGATCPFTDTLQWAWGRSKKYAAGEAAVHAGGRAINGSTNKVEQAVLSPDCPVSVAGGVLKCIGKATLANLSVDCAGAGTIDGFDFAQEGTLNVDGMTGDSAELPITFANANGVENIAGWTLKVGGSETCRYRHSVVGGKIVVCKVGTMLIVR